MKYSIKTRLIFAIYYASGYILLNYCVSYWGKVNLYLLNGQPVFFPYGMGLALLYSGLVAAFLFVTVLVISPRLYQTGQSMAALWVFLFDSFCFAVVSSASVIFLGFDLYYLTDAAVLALLLGLIDAFSFVHPDFDFLEKRELSEQVKLFKLNLMVDKMFKAMSLFTAFLFSIVVGVGIDWIMNAPEQSQGVITRSIASMGVYIGAGIAAGIYYRVFVNIRQIEAMALTLKNQEDHHFWGGKDSRL